MRLQLALNVANLDEAVNYYSKLFASKPRKRRPGYANFAIENPPLKLVLFENPQAVERLNHLGVEVFEESQLEEAKARLIGEGIFSRDEESTVCCHAEQNKIWSQEPQGLEWEWYRIVDDNPQPGTKENSACCPIITANNAVCCSG